MEAWKLVVMALRARDFDGDREHADRIERRQRFADDDRKVSSAMCWLQDEMDAFFSQH